MAYSTRQRTAVWKALEEADRPLTPHEIQDAAKSLVPSLGMATVYRCLKELTRDGDARLVELQGAPPHYESSKRPHHHFFFCKQCRRLFDLIGCAGGIMRMAPNGFDVERHEIVLYGSCDACRPTKHFDQGHPKGHNRANKTIR
jgi:Fur family ferric uptake transcriptional regulator